MQRAGHVARMGQKKNSYRILFAKPNRMRLLARVDVKIILNRISEKQDVAVWTTFLQRGALCDVWSLTHVSDQISQTCMKILYAACTEATS
jgi:hypothetical protein